MICTRPPILTACVSLFGSLMIGMTHSAWWESRSTNQWHCFCFFLIAQLYSTEVGGHEARCFRHNTVHGHAHSKIARSIQSWENNNRSECFPMTFEVVPWCFMLIGSFNLWGFVVCKHGGLEDDFPFQFGHFQIFSGSMLIFHGVPKWVFNSKAPPPATPPSLDGRCRKHPSGLSQWPCLGALILSGLKVQNLG